MCRGTTRSRARLSVALVLAAAIALATGAAARGPERSEARQRKLDQNWRLCLKKTKGPYTQNFCVCRNGEKKPVMLPDGRIVSPCGGRARFCAAFRTPWAEALAEEGVYIANLFARDLWLWDSFPDHHDLVRGYILEKFFVETHPDHKLARMRAYGGLAGAEYEARDAPRFFERYLGLSNFDEPRHYLLAYELQRRFYVRDDQGQIAKARNLASAIQNQRGDFKPLRDAVHNQISATLVPKLAAYRDDLAPGAVRGRVDELIAEIEKLTSLDESALRAQLPAIEDAAVRQGIASRLPSADAGDLAAIAGLADVMVFARRTVEAKQSSPADRRRLIDLSITASAVIQRHGMELVEGGPPFTAREHLELLASLSNAAYGAGLLMERERATVTQRLEALVKDGSLSRGDPKQSLAEAARVIEWSQRGTLYAFEEVRAPWMHLLPETSVLPDDVLRGSPLLVYARVLERVESWAAGSDPIRHEVFGAELDRDVRALNPGLALGTLRVSPAQGGYSREEVVALPETPADLGPAAGIFTRGEGNVLSHVQLLARALGIPNVVVGPSVFEAFAPRDGRKVFYIVTPGGRVIVKETSAMTDRDRSVVAEYTRNQKRSGDGGLGSRGKKLHIDRGRLDVSDRRAIDLATVRRKDSGVRCGPKAAYLGELKHLFRDKVSRGAVVPFGAYYDHYRRTRVTVPKELASLGIAEPGEPLPGFVERTYATFFGEMIPAGTDERELSTWIRPRLALMRASLEREALAEELKESIRAELARQGLLLRGDPSQTVGVFIRSDTNVEDLDDFNGAGLNLTLFNRRSLEDIYAGVKAVWASPFTYRSFSWRQTLIDEPLWVLPSVVILESVPAEKSGVLVTADTDRGDPSKMLVATSEGVGGAVDGSPAETLVWSPDGVELVTMFKSPQRRLLKAGGGSAIVPSTGSEYVLSEAELEALVSTSRKIRDRFEPSRDAQGRPRPWDVEYGFAEGKLWLFQARPFVGSESLRNVPALAAYEVVRRSAAETVSLEEVIR
jgi:hypothetical protein